MHRPRRAARTVPGRILYHATTALLAVATAAVAASPAVAQTGSPPRLLPASVKTSALYRSHFATCTPKMQALHLCSPGGTFTGEPIQSFLGRGWNELTDVDGPSLYSCLDPVQLQAPGLTGATIESKLAVVASTSTITDTLSLDARVSGSIPLKSVPVGGTLEGDVLRMSSLHQSVVSIVARTAITYRPQHLSAVPAVSQAALATLTAQGPLAFREKCGDKYVDSVAPGGELIAFMQVYSRDTATQSKLAARLGAALGGSDDLGAALKSVNAPSGAAVNTGGSFTTSFEGHELQIQIDTLQRGGSNRTNPTTVSQLLNLYRTFPSTVARFEDTVPMTFHLQPYTEAGNGGQVRGRLFGVTSQATLITNMLWPTYVNALTAQQALNFWTQQCGAQPQNCSSYFPYDASLAQSQLSKLNLTLANIEAAVDQCGRGDTCTAASLRTIVPADQGASLVATLPMRRQFYTVGARAFMEAAAQAGATSSGTVLAEPLLPGNGQCVIDQKEGWNVNGTPTAQWKRVWTLRGVTGTTCRFHIFKGGRLAAPWDIASVDFDIPQSGNQVLEKMPSRSDLTLRLKQVSPLASFAPDTQATLKAMTLVGPAGDPATEPWRQAIRH